MNINNGQSFNKYALVYQNDVVIVKEISIVNIESHKKTFKGTTVVIMGRFKMFVIFINYFVFLIY